MGEFYGVDNTSSLTYDKIRIDDNGDAKIDIGARPKILERRAAKYGEFVDMSGDEFEFQFAAQTTKYLGDGSTVHGQQGSHGGKTWCKLNENVWVNYVGAQTDADWRFKVKFIESVQAGDGEMNTGTMQVRNKYTEMQEHHNGKKHMILGTLAKLISKRTNDFTSKASIRYNTNKKTILVNTCDDTGTSSASVAVPPATIRLMPIEYMSGSTLKTVYLMNPKPYNEDMYIVSHDTYDSTYQKLPEPAADADKDVRQKPINFKDSTWKKFHFNLNKVEA